MDLVIEIIETAGTTPIIEISYDEQSTWNVLIPALALNTITRVRTLATSTDSVNFRTSTPAGLTLGRFLVIGATNAG